MAAPFQRIVVHPTRKGWTWTQVSRNGAAVAVAPSVFENKSNAVRAGHRVADIINHGMMVHGIMVADASNLAVVEVRDTDPGYV